MRTVYTELFHPGLSSHEGYHGSVQARGVYSTWSDFTEILTRSQTFAFCPTAVPKKTVNPLSWCIAQGTYRPIPVSLYFVLCEVKVVIQELELGDKSIEISQPWYSKYALANMPAYQTLRCCLFSFPKVSKYNFFTPMASIRC